MREGGACQGSKAEAGADLERGWNLFIEQSGGPAWQEGLCPRSDGAEARMWGVSLFTRCLRPRSTGGALDKKERVCADEWHVDFIGPSKSGVRQRLTNSCYSCHRRAKGKTTNCHKYHFIEERIS